MKMLIAAAALVAALAGAAPLPAPLDSQMVLQRYSARLLRAEDPKVLIFSYTVSQAGPHNIEQAHKIYRSGDLVRDETLMVDGARAKSIRIARYRNRYTLVGLAPRLTQYAFLFQKTTRDGSDVLYDYRAVPLSPGGSFVVDGIVIDGHTFLPSLIRFHTSNGVVTGKGSIAFARSGNYWVPVDVNVDARIGGKPARERIAFNSYQFPASLPKSTFKSAKPLPKQTLPTF